MKTFDEYTIKESDRDTQAANAKNSIKKLNDTWQDFEAQMFYAADHLEDSSHGTIAHKVDMLRADIEKNYKQIVTYVKQTQ